MFLYLYHFKLYKNELNITKSYKFLFRMISYKLLWFYFCFNLLQQKSNENFFIRKSKYGILFQKNVIIAFYLFLKVRNL